MAWPVTHINDYATSLLALIEARYAADGIALPKLRYTTVGEIVADCEEAVVSLARLFHGRPGFENIERLGLGNDLLVAEFHAVVGRPWPTLTQQGTMPSATQMNNAALVAHVDAWELADGVLQAVLTQQWPVGCDMVSIVRCEPIGPEGGFAGQKLIVQVGL